MEYSVFSLLADVIAAAIGILIVIGAYRNGFMRTAVLLVGYVAAVLVAFWLSRGLSTFVYESFIRGAVQSGIDNAVAASAEGLPFAAVLNGVFDTLPGFIVNPILSGFGGEEAMIQSLQESTGGALTELGNVIAGTIVAPVVTELLRVIFCLLIFVICAIIVRSVASLFKRLYAIPIVGTVNSVLGGVLGIVKAAVLLFILAAVVALIISVTGDQLHWLNSDIVESTFLLRPFYDLVV